MIFHPMYFLFIGPPLLLGLYAQWKVKRTFMEMSQKPAGMSGAMAAHQMLESAGLYDVRVEPTQGFLSDHYDPRGKVLRLSPDVYEGRSLAALGVACHEAGHAFQDAKGYAPLQIRNLAVPAANFGSNIGLLMAFVGAAMNFGPLLLIGIILFSAVVFFQVINLPVEFDASARAKQYLSQAGLVNQAEASDVARVLNAAALTYVAATLQAIMTLAYYVMRFMNSRH